MSDKLHVLVAAALLFGSTSTLLAASDADKTKRHDYDYVTPPWHCRTGLGVISWTRNASSRASRTTDPTATSLADRAQPNAKAQRTQLLMHERP
jgi:hypothetical protein